MKAPLWSRITDPTPAAVEEVDQASSTLTLKTVGREKGGPAKHGGGMLILLLRRVPQSQSLSTIKLPMRLYRRSK
ncbi:hypothetical protein ACE6H2_023577 [Prunus campanulata]